jgi:hypothetical protein
MVCGRQKNCLFTALAFEDCMITFNMIEKGVFSQHV